MLRSCWQPLVDDVSVTPTSTVNMSETLYYGFGGDTVGMRVDGVLSWIFSDQLGSTGVTYKADGSGTVRQFYYPFGGIRNPGGAPVINTDVGFTGQRLDTSTGLMFYQARYYDPLTARFISADTIVPDPGNPQDFNRYTYVRNNPLGYTDPSGNCSRIAKVLENRAAGQGVSIDLGSGADCPDSFTLWGDVRNVGKGIIDAPSNIGNTVLFLVGWMDSQMPQSEWERTMDALAASMGTDGPRDLAIFPTLGVDPGYEGAYLGGSLLGPAIWAKVLKGAGAFASRLAARFADDLVPPGPYVRPSGATTPAQRASVQGQPCVECGNVAFTQVADHINPLVREWYETGGINLDRMRSLDAIQPMCPTCSASQGGRLSWYSRLMREVLGFD